MSATVPEVLFTALFGVFALLGLRSSWRLWRIYLHDGTSREQLLLGSLAVIASVITAAAIYYGVLSARRLLGFEPFAWSPAVGTIVASVVLLIPAFLERVVDRIGRRALRERRDGDDRRGSARND